MPKIDLKTWGEKMKKFSDRLRLVLAQDYSAELMSYKDKGWYIICAIGENKYIVNAMIYNDGENDYETVVMDDILNYIDDDNGAKRWVEIKLIGILSDTSYYYRVCKISKNEYWVFENGMSQYIVDGKVVWRTNELGPIRLLERMRDR